MNVAQIITLNKSMLDEYVDRISATTLTQVETGTGDSVAAFGGVEVQKRQAVRDEPVHASRRRRGRNPRRHRAVHRAIHLGRAVVPASGSSPDAELSAAPDRGRMTAFQGS